MTCDSTFRYDHTVPADSYNKFLELMREAGVEAARVPITVDSRTEYDTALLCEIGLRG